MSRIIKIDDDTNILVVNNECSKVGCYVQEHKDRDSTSGLGVMVIGVLAKMFQEGDSELTEFLNKKIDEYCNDEMFVKMNLEVMRDEA